MENFLDPAQASSFYYFQVGTPLPGIAVVAPPPRGRVSKKRSLPPELHLEQVGFFRALARCPAPPLQIPHIDVEFLAPSDSRA